MSCTIIIKDEVNCQIIGLDEEDNEYFIDKYAMLVPNRFHVVTFQLGHWDGKIKFFKENGDTYVNLLEDIIPKITRLGYKIKLKDQRRKVRYQAEPIDKNYLYDVVLPDGSNLVFHDHQVKVINDLLEEGGGLGKAATGAGKTFITGCLTLIHERLDDLKVLTIVPNKTLVRQTHKDYVMMGIDAGIFYGDKKETNHKHLVSTWQSLKNVPDMIRDYDVVIVDEVHMAKGPILQKLLLEHGRHIAYRFGVTGTLPDEEIDKLSVKVAIGPMVTEVEAHELQEKSLLSNLEIEVVIMEHDFTTEYETYKKEFVKTLTRPEVLTYRKFKDSYLPDWTSEKNFNASHSPHINHIAAKLEEHRDKYGNVLCLVDGVKQGKKLAERMEGAYFLSGKDSIKEREKIYAQYADRDDIILIATAQIASTGLNIKRIFTLAYVNFGKSGVKIIQSIGRGLRMDTDKDWLKVLDFTNDLKYARRHTSARLKYYKTAKYPYTKTTVKVKDFDSGIFA